MANIGPVPINMNRATLKVATDNYEKSVSSAKIIPVTPIAKFKGIGGNTEKRAGVPDWTCVLGFAQDWTTVNSLSQYLQANAGQTKTLELTPETGSAKVAITVLIVAGTVGGDVDTTTTDSVTLEVIGQPTFTPAA